MLSQSPSHDEVVAIDGRVFCDGLNVGNLTNVVKRKNVVGALLRFYAFSQGKRNRRICVNVKEINIEACLEKQITTDNKLVELRGHVFVHVLNRQTTSHFQKLPYYIG